MTRIHRLLVLATLFSASLFAGGPVYTRYAYGDVLLFNSSRTFALGGGGFALLGDNFISRMNPASLAFITKTRFSAGFDFNRYSSETATGKSTFGRSSFEGLAFAAPINKDEGIVFSFDATPYSAVGYAVNVPDTTGGVGSTQQYFGGGGLTTVALGLSMTAAERVHVGGKVVYYYGRTNQLNKINFTDDDRTDYNLDRSVYHSGLGFTLGTVLDDVGALLNLPSLSKVSAGVVISTPVTLNAREETTSSIVADTTFVRFGTSGIPLSLGLGLAFKPTERTNVIGDLFLQQWSGVSLYASPSNLQLQNSMRVSGGVEFLPARDAVSYWERVIYRAGAAYANTYYNINGQGISEALLTAGLGLPISTEARLNLGLQAGVRGTTANGLQRDVIVRFSAAISGNELWFLKFEEE